MTVAALNALAPVVLLIGLGHFLKRCRALDEAFWPQAERICYFVLLPALFFHGTATAEIGELPAGRLSVALIASTLVLSALIVAARPLIRTDGAGFTSVFQGGIRFNNYIGLMMVSGLLGAKGIAYAAICNAALVPTVNVLAVLVFARYGEVRLSPLHVLAAERDQSARAGLHRRPRLPYAGLTLPFGVEPAMKALGGAALPLGLLCVGRGFALFGHRRLGVDLFSPRRCSSWRRRPPSPSWPRELLGLPSTPAAVALLYQSLPTASSAYILARQMGGDAPLMAGITAAQTIMAAATLPLALGLLAPG